MLASRPGCTRPRFTIALGPPSSLDSDIWPLSVSRSWTYTLQVSPCVRPCFPFLFYSMRDSYDLATDVSTALRRINRHLILSDAQTEVVPSGLNRHHPLRLLLRCCMIGGGADQPASRTRLSSSRSTRRQAGWPWCRRSELVPVRTGGSTPIDAGPGASLPFLFRDGAIKSRYLHPTGSYHRHHIVLLDRPAHVTARSERGSRRYQISIK